MAAVEILRPFREFSLLFGSFGLVSFDPQKPFVVGCEDRNIGFRRSEDAFTDVIDRWRCFLCRLRMLYDFVEADKAEFTDSAIFLGP